MSRSSRLSFKQGACGHAASIVVLALLTLNAAAQSGSETPPDAVSAPDLILHDTVTGGQNNTYIEHPFAVPPGTTRVTLTFSYTGKEQRTTLDLGLLDPHGLRCWSGGNKSTLTVSLADATPSCLPGPVDPGPWKLLLGVPNIRAAETAEYTADLFFTRSGLVADEPSALRKPLRTGPAWYRGDLHLHTAHSDGSCNSLAGVKVPCPVFVTAEAAARRGLDFIAITDHNTTSHYDAMREIAPYFDTLLLIPGREITTFHGHANLFGTEAFLDFRLGSPGVPDSTALLRRAAALGGLLSLNHPAAPTGEACMGCGWDPKPPADLHFVQAIEAINSGAEDGPFSGVPFWETQLNAGFRLTGIGGSDNHNAQRPLDEIGSVGSPTTVVYATELSTKGILAGIRAGHVFVDLTGSKDRVLELSARSGTQTAIMGDALHADRNASVDFSMHIVGVSGASIVLLRDGKPYSGTPNVAITSADQTLHVPWQSDGLRHWFRADVRSADGKLLLLGNAIYINWP